MALWARKACGPRHGRADLQRRIQLHARPARDVASASAGRSPLPGSCSGPGQTSGSRVERPGHRHVPGDQHPFRAGERHLGSLRRDRLGRLVHHHARAGTIHARARVHQHLRPAAGSADRVPCSLRSPRREPTNTCRISSGVPPNYRSVRPSGSTSRPTRAEVELPRDRADFRKAARRAAGYHGRVRDWAAQDSPLRSFVGLLQCDSLANPTEPPK